ncbi:MAG: hypothetical protein HFE66_00925 [Clostridiales bacterium]|jgi:hypothetical protein|nr:hypothetical protein [Clostridiales bacterium]
MVKTIIGYIAMFFPIFAYWVSVYLLRKRGKALRLSYTFEILIGFIFIQMFLLAFTYSFQSIFYYFIDSYNGPNLLIDWILFLGCLSILICCVRYIYLSKEHKTISLSICDAIPALFSNYDYNIKYHSLVRAASSFLNVKFILPILGENVSFWHGEIDYIDYKNIYDLISDKNKTVYMVCIDYLLSCGEYNNNYRYEPFIFCLWQLIGRDSALGCTICKSIEKAHKIAQKQEYGLYEEVQESSRLYIDSEYRAFSHIFIEYGKLPDLNNRTSILSLYQLMLHMVENEETYYNHYIEYLVKQISKKFTPTGKFIGDKL